MPALFHLLLNSPAIRHHVYMIMHENSLSYLSVNCIPFQKGGILSACYQPVSISADNWFIKARSMCYHVYVIMHVQDP